MYTPGDPDAMMRGIIAGWRNVDLKSAVTLEPTVIGNYKHICLKSETLKFIEKIFYYKQEQSKKAAERQEISFYK